MEYCCDDDSELVREALRRKIRGKRITRSSANMATPQGAKIIDQLIAEDGPCVLWGSLPCTDWTAWQNYNMWALGPKFRAELKARRALSRKYLAAWIERAEANMAQGGLIGFEWPDNCTGWQLQELQDFIARHNLFTVKIDGCTLEVHDKMGNAIKKRWRIITNSAAVVDMLEQCKCDHSHTHVPCAGAATNQTGHYTEFMAQVIIAAFYGADTTGVPAMPCVKKPEEHREKDVLPNIINACIGRLLSNKEMHEDPRAIAAVQHEMGRLCKKGTFDLKGVMEFKDLKKELERTKEEVHFGDIFPIATLKFAEMPFEMQQMKGRVVFRGSNITDQHGNSIIFEQLRNAPASMEAGRANLTYGAAPGHKSSCADAIQAYIQSYLKGCRTFARIPPMLRPPEWDGMEDPVCLMILSLYGHPRAGDYWYDDCKARVESIGFEEIPGWRGCFFDKRRRLFLIVYVDDFMLSGRAEHHGECWDQLKKLIDLENVTDVHRFLGCHYQKYQEGKQSVVVSNMRNYCETCVDAYCTAANISASSLRKVTTPYVEEAAIADDDYIVDGQLAGDACSLLMKTMYVARLARSDVLKAVTELGAFVTKWSRACDIKLHRLFAYLYHHLDQYMVMRIGDALEDWQLVLYTDADLSGEKSHCRSTSGNMLLIEGPNTTAPQAYQVRTQKATADNTAESEIVSLNLGTKGAGLPALDLWETLLQRPIILKTMEDNEAAIKIVRKGYSPALRYLHRTQRVKIGFLSEVYTNPELATIEHCPSKDMRADPLTKSISPAGWPRAMELLCIEHFPKGFQIKK